MSFQAMAWAVAQHVGDASAKYVLITLANYADADGVCWPSFERLAHDTELSRITVIRKVEYLESKGLVVRRRRTHEGANTSNLYTLPMQEGVVSGRHHPVSPRHQGGIPEIPEPINEPLPPSPQRGAASTLPAGWRPPDEDALRQQFPSLNLDAELGEFDHHYRSRGTLDLDWPGRFRSWLARSERWRREAPARPARPRSKREENARRADAALARLAEIPVEPAGSGRGAEGGGGAAPIDARWSDASE